MKFRNLYTERKYIVGEKESDREKEMRRKIIIEFIFAW